MYQGTTPTFTLTFPDTVDLTDATEVVVTFSTNKKVLYNKSGDALTVQPQTIEVFLTQEETLAIPAGAILIEVNWTYQEGGVSKRACSTIERVEVNRNLLQEVI